MSKHMPIAVIFGGAGFLGRHLVQNLARRGYRIRSASRRPDLAHHLQPLGDLGQIKPVQANIRVAESVERVAEGADVVINLTGTFSAFGKNNFDAVHVEGAQNIAKAAKAAGARLIHVSAIGADIESPARYGKTKAEGEQAVFDMDKKAIIFRPSVMFGPEDDFFNRFGAMAMISPFLPLVGGKTRFQPVYVGDVAEAIARAVEGQVKPGQIYELGGLEILTFRQCLELLSDIIERKPWLVPVPFFIARIIGFLTGWMPGAPITSDQVKMLKIDNVVSKEAAQKKRTLEGIDIKPTRARAILPSYLYRFRPHGQFSRRGEV